jgi:hypothetical protein
VKGKGKSCVFLPKFIIDFGTGLVQKSSHCTTKDILHASNIHCAQHPLFLTKELSDIIAQKLQTYVSHYRCQVHSGSGDHLDVKKVPVVYTKDLLEYKDRHSLKLLQGCAALVHDERHLVILGETLERQGFMNGKKNMIGFPHRDLIVLPFPVDDHDSMKRVKEIEIKRICTEPAKENTIVFSSLALLSTVCWIVLPLTGKITPLLTGQMALHAMTMSYIYIPGL